MLISTLIGSFEIVDVDLRLPHPDEALRLALDTLRTMPINGLRYPSQDSGSG